MIVDKVVLHKGEEIFELEKENMTIEFIIEPYEDESERKFGFDKIVSIRWRE